MNGLSVVIPVYNSEATLGELVARLAQTLPGLSEQYELILVNDGSRDGSWHKIAELSSQHPFTRGINLMRNYGQHNALLCGIRSARYDITVTMDDDLQHPPEEVHKLLRKLDEGFDVVYGVPDKLPHSWWRNWFSVLIKRILAHVMGLHNFRDIAAFRAFRTSLRSGFARYENPNVVIDVLLSWSTARFGKVIVHEKPRELGKSNYNFLKLFQYALVVLTAFSTVPLRVASIVGFFFTFFGVAIFLYVLAVYFLLGSNPGFPFLASIIAIFSGTQLFALGIIGEYLARIFDRSMDRPAYMIADRVEGGEPEVLPANREPYSTASPQGPLL